MAVRALHPRSQPSSGSETVPPGGSNETIDQARDDIAKVIQLDPNQKKKTSSPGARFSNKEKVHHGEAVVKQLVPNRTAQEFLDAQPESLPSTMHVVSETPKLLITVSDDLPEGSYVTSGFSFLEAYDNQIMHAQLLKLELTLYADLISKAEQLYRRRVASLPEEERDKQYHKFEQAIYAINYTIATELKPGQDNQAYEQLMQGLDRPTMKDTLGQEVCLQKSLITHHFFRAMGFQSKLALESYPGQDKEGHAYVLVYLGGTRQKFHPNMPIPVIGGETLDYKPYVEGIEVGNLNEASNTTTSKAA